MFERCYCVNLDRRPEKWAAFCQGLPADWAFPRPERFAAIDGKRFGKGGAFGCWKSHQAIIERCINDGVGSVLLLEDDAEFPEGFTSRSVEWLRRVPDDWDLLYLGGLHMRKRERRPRPINDCVMRAYNVNFTHAWAIAGKALLTVWEWISQAARPRGPHIDHHLGALHESGRVNVYCPAVWLVAQRGGWSDVAGRELQGRVQWIKPNGQ